ncbi:MAG: mannitol dehydrogenase family protein [Pseudomonadota bacterium]
MNDHPRLKRETAPPKPGIVHLGPGAFFKAFNAVYTDDVLRAEGGDWGIVAVSLQSDRAARELRPQGCAYTSVTLGATGQEARVIEALSDVLVARQDPQAVLAIMSDAAISIVSLTITEKGYCHNPATGRLRLDAPEIRDDLANPTAPQTAPGLIVEALARRFAAGVPPLTVMSCDNLPDNGALMRGVVLEFARARDPQLADRIAKEVPFPATMVDRITPATTPDGIARLTEQAGYVDLACVQHEPFRQWVIEDHFVGGRRPRWEVGGAQLVRSVAAHETMKLRCLNGTHSTLAYLGYLAGYESIAETVADPDFAALCTTLWEREILPTVPQPEGEDLRAYVASLLDRYRNPAIHHRTWQIAMDGSQKLPQRVLGTVKDRLDAGHVPQGLCLTVAGWMRYVGGVDEKGQAIDVRDPMAADLRAASDSAESASGKVSALLSMDAVFDTVLAGNPRFAQAVTDAYRRIRDDGVAAAVRQYLGT